VNTKGRRASACLIATDTSEPVLSREDQGETLGQYSRRHKDDQHAES
jgi:hypothetical protein